MSRFQKKYESRWKKQKRRWAKNRLASDTWTPPRRFYQPEEISDGPAHLVEFSMGTSTMWTTCWDSSLYFLQLKCSQRATASRLSSSSSSSARSSHTNDSARKTNPRKALHRHSEVNAAYFSSHPRQAEVLWWKRWWKAPTEGPLAWSHADWCEFNVTPTTQGRSFSTKRVDVGSYSRNSATPVYRGVCTIAVRVWSINN